LLPILPPSAPGSRRGPLLSSTAVENNKHGGPPLDTKIASPRHCPCSPPSARLSRPRIPPFHAATASTSSLRVRLPRILVLPRGSRLTTSTCLTAIHMMAHPTRIRTTQRTMATRTKYSTARGASWGARCQSSRDGIGKSERLLLGLEGMCAASTHPTPPCPSPIAIGTGRSMLLTQELHMQSGC